MPSEESLAPTVAEYANKMDAEAARTRKFCSDQPAQQEVRAALLHVEKQLHQLGWDGPPTMFLLHQDTQTHRIRYAEFEEITQMLVEQPYRSQDVLNLLADVFEHMRRQVHVQAPQMDPVVQGLPPRLRDMLCLPANPDNDLIAPKGRWRFHGVGLASEAWMLLNAGHTNKEFMRETVRHGTIAAHPQRLEVRRVIYAARDGWTWQVLRLRRTAGIALPRHCIVLNYDNDFTNIGSTPHALTRICNAIAANPVPITPPMLPGYE